MELPEFTQQLTPAARFAWIAVAVILILLFAKIVLFFALLGGIAWCIRWLMKNGPDGPRAT